MGLIEKANKVYLENFPAETWFERAIFFSWYCGIRNCKFCYMSTQPGVKKSVRSIESLLAEVIICRKQGWKIGFISGGVGAFDKTKIFELIKTVNKITREGVWLNVGVLNEEQLKNFKPYLKGVVGSIETINREVHEFVCPSKPIKPYIEMFKISNELNLKNAMTIILGLGETKEDYLKLKEFINKNKIEKIHFYCLNPQKGTIFEKKKSPSAQYQAWWIAKTRIDFPKIDIQCGIWRDKVDRISLLLKAGANSISKFPAIKEFNSNYAIEIERQAKLAGREFKGSLTRLHDADWDGEISKLNGNLKIKGKLEGYLEKMKKGGNTKIILP